MVDTSWVGVFSPVFLSYQPVLKLGATSLDRYHIVAKLNKAIDEVRAGEHRQMQKEM